MAICALQPVSTKQIFKSHAKNASTASRPARLICTAQLDNSPLEPRRLAGAALGAAAALSLFFSTPSAQAVSGGGGSGNSLAFQDFSGQNLQNKKYVKGDLRGANFSKANLSGATLFGAIAVDANFKGANMTGTDLESIDLEGADLSDAILEGAMLSNAQFRLVKSINGADFTDALIRKDIAMSLCKIADGVNPVTGVSTRESLNCP